MDGRDEAFAALAVLRAEAFIDDQRLQLCPGAAGQQLAQGDADGKVDAEGLTPAE